MNKIRIVKKMGINHIMVKSLKGQQLNEYEVYSINNNEVDGLLRVEVVQKNNAFKLFYNVSGFTTFRQFLKMPLTKKTFAAMLQSILDCLLSMKKAFFHQENMLMDFNYVMVNPATQKIYFAYVPIPNFENQTPLRNFLLNIIQYCTFVPGEDMDYVKDYISILNSGINFSEFDLEEYIKGLSGDNSRPGYKECPNCHTKLPQNTSYCTKCGAKVSGYTGSIGKKGTYNPFDYQEEQHRPRVPQGKPRPQSTQNLSDRTTVLGTYFNATTVLTQNSRDSQSSPYLVREKTKEKIRIAQSLFKIGKESKYCDYYVPDNSAVSRQHAEIITREHRYYVVDLNSTNKTYVDGRAVAAEKEVEIFDGTRLRFANEDFVFYTDEKRGGE